MGFAERRWKSTQTDEPEESYRSCWRWCWAYNPPRAIIEHIDATTSQVGNPVCRLRWPTERPKATDRQGCSFCFAWQETGRRNGGAFRVWFLELIYVDAGPRVRVQACILTRWQALTGELATRRHNPWYLFVF